MCMFSMDCVDAMDAQGWDVKSAHTWHDVTALVLDTKMPIMGACCQRPSVITLPQELLPYTSSLCVHMHVDSCIVLATLPGAY